VVTNYIEEKEYFVMEKRKIFLLPGDGVGIEVMRETEKIIHYMRDSLGYNFVCEKGRVGGAAYNVCRRPISEEDISRALSADAVLLGAVGGPEWETVPYHLRPEAGLLRLRKSLQLFANLRPVICYPSLVNSSSLKSSLIRGLDIMIVRELTGGIYFGEPKKIMDLGEGQTRAIDTQVYETYEIERIAHVAFKLARLRRCHVTSMDKRNVMRTGFLWNQTVTSIHAAHYNEEIRLKHILADAGAMELVRKPQQFDVIVTDNLFGDILSDMAAALTGSLGLLPSASLGDHNEAKGTWCRAIYEPVHGSAPDIAGKGIVNPIAMIASLAMCFRYSFGMNKEAFELEKAISTVLDDGLRTKDIYSEGTQKVSTREMGEAILSQFKKGIS
jgi:3-isopropylmalate dehydrogenase